MLNEDCKKVDELDELELEGDELELEDDELLLLKDDDEKPIVSWLGFAVTQGTSSEFKPHGCQLSFSSLNT